MYRVIIHIIFFILFLFVAKSYGYISKEDYKVENQIIESVSNSGNIILKKSEVKKEILSAGNIYAESAMIGSIKASGDVTLKDTNVLKNTIVSGNLISQNSSLRGDTTVADSARLINTSIYNNIKVSNAAFFENSCVKGASYITNDLSTKKTKFIGAINFSGEKASFDASEINDITITSKNISPVISLTNNTKIKGKLIFKDKVGLIKVDDTIKQKINIINGIIKK